MNIQTDAVIPHVIVGCALLAFAGCAATERANQESLLIAAGFHERTPQTPKQQELYAAAPSYKMLRATVKRKIFYAYKDEAKGVAYVGGPDEYQRYTELAIRQRIAQDAYMAAEMNREAAWGWYGAWGWGRRGIWW
jgi:hypothetical protein